MSVTPGLPSKESASLTRAAASRKSVNDSPASMLSATARESSSRFSMRDVFGRIAIFEHGHVAGFVEHVTEKIGGLAILEPLLQAPDELVKGADWSGGATRGTSGKKHFDGGPECGAIGLCEITERVERCLADAARRDVEHAQKRNVVLGMHGEADVG